jgi:hypothetical protein
MMGDRVLLLCPKFFSYHELIGSGLKQAGFDVVWWDTRVSNSAIHKFLLRVVPGLVVPLSERQRARDLQSESIGADIKHVLVVKGEGLSPQTVLDMRRAMPHARFSLYLWDGVENCKGALALAPHFDCVMTFDPLDAERFGWGLRPLFSRTTTPHNPVQFQYDWCFVGTLHGDRHRVIDALRHNEPGLRSFVFGFAPSRAVLAARHMLDPTLWRAPPKTLSIHPLPFAEVEAIARSSRCVVDIEHIHQRGLTMRTIETLLRGQKLCTTNSQIMSSDLFAPGRVHVISRQHPTIPHSFLESPVEPVPASVAVRYDVKTWALDVIGLSPQPLSKTT